MEGSDRSLSGANRGKRRSEGFSISEILIVLTVMGILASIGFTILGTVLPSSRDSKRDQDVLTIAEKLELYYKTTPAAMGYTYPPTSVGVAGLKNIINSNDSIMAPNQSTMSLSIAATNATLAPTVNQYIYQPLTRSGALCTNSAAALCSRYILYYRREVSGSVVKIDSLGQQ